MLIHSSMGTGIACSAHTLAEAYSTLTTYKLARRLRPVEAFQIIERWEKLCNVITLSSREYVDLLQGAAVREIAGGTIYDALHIACARKAGAKYIYTWNVRHFRAAAPDLAETIFEP